MKCPYCGYEYGHLIDEGDVVEVGGEYGDFYELPIKMEREAYGDIERRTIYGCPKCGVLFTDL